MSSLSAAPTALLDVPLPKGSDRPRICTFPPSIDTSGDEIADFAARYGLILKPWQRYVLQVAMGERSDGRWAAGEVGLVVPRQNGKGAILEALELAALFLLGVESIVHTAQQFRTATDAFKRIRRIVERSPELLRRVKRILNSPVEKSIELKSGPKLWFIARGPNAGRGLTCTDLLIFDEAYDLSDGEMEALVPTMTVAPNPQVWYSSSAGKDHSVVLAGVRRRGIEGASTLAYLEWSVPQPERDEPLPDPMDPMLLAMANPELGGLVSGEYLAIERGAFEGNLRGLCRERLGVFDVVAGHEPPEISAAEWRGQEDEDSQPESPYGVAFAIAVAQDQSWSSVASAGRRADGGMHVEVVKNGRGTRWVPEWIADRQQRWGSCAVVVNPTGPEGALIADIEAQGVEIVQPSGREIAQAFGQFVAGIKTEHDYWHRPDGSLDRALEAAVARDSGDAKRWDQRGDADISPLVAVTHAAWGFVEHGGTEPHVW